MQKTSKHRSTKLLNIFDFSGGLNFLMPPDNIADNECRVMDNLMFDPSSSLITTRPAFRRVCELSNIRAAFFSEARALIVADTTLYKITSDRNGEVTATELAQVSLSSSRPNFALWDDKIIVATGSENIYSVDEKDELKTYTPLDVAGKPIKPTHVFIRAGRIVLYREDDDTLYYSNVGELAFTWTTTGDEAATQASAKYIQVGYKDAGEIASVVALSQDIIIFKTSGVIYRLRGEYPDWAVSEIARGVYPLKNSAKQMLNSVIFMTKDGLMSLDTVQSYGDIQVNKSLSRKINPILTAQLGSEAELFYLAQLQSLFIDTKENEANFVMSLSNGAFTRWALPFETISAGYFASALFFAARDGVYSASQNSSVEFGAPLRSRLVGRTFHNLGKYLVKGVKIFLKPQEAGAVEFSIAGLKYNVFPSLSVKACADETRAALNNAMLVLSEWEEFSFFDVSSAERMNVEINIEGRASVRADIKVAEIGGM